MIFAILLVSFYLADASNKVSKNKLATPAQLIANKAVSKKAANSFLEAGSSGSASDDGDDDSLNQVEQTNNAAEETESPHEECFPGFSRVTLKSGDQVPLMDVKIGDTVTVMDTHGKIGYSDVMYVPHAANNKVRTFIDLNFEGGVVSMTPHHLVYVGDASGASVPVMAKSVKVGDLLWVASEEGSSLTPVTSISQSKNAGVYTVVTGTGNVVVEGVLCSNFAYTHTIANVYYSFHRLMYSLGLSHVISPLPQAASNGLELSGSSASVASAFFSFNEKLGPIAASVFDAIFL